MTTSLRPAARRLDFVVQAGDDRPIVIPVLSADGQPRDVTGWTARATVRAHRRATTSLHTWSGATALCGPAGVTLLVDDSAAWTWRAGEWDLVVTEPGGAHRVEAYGSVAARGVATR